MSRIVERNETVMEKNREHGRKIVPKVDVPEPPVSVTVVVLESHVWGSHSTVVALIYPCCQRNSTMIVVFTLQDCVEVLVCLISDDVR